MRKEDICTHWGDDISSYMGAVTPPIFQSSLFAECQGNELDAERRFVYTRVSNPTTEIAEKKIAELEQGEKAKCFSSGMGAISAAIMHYIKQGSHVVCVESCYGPARRFLGNYMSRFGITVSFVSGDNTDEIEAAITDKTDLIYLECPSTYMFKLQNLKEVAELAKRKEIATVLDNTYSTPVYQNPLKYGIDLVVHSASKYLGGHSDLVGGVVIGKAKEIDKIAENERELYGAVMGPFDSWLLVRGIRTLPVRMEQHNKNAMRFAEHFAGHKVVKEVIYPWHESYPQYALAKEQMSGCSGLMSMVFDLPGDVIDSIARDLHFFYRGPSWGGYESLISTVGSHAEDSGTMKKGLVRIHIGLENVETLIDDMESAIRKNLQ